MVSRPVASAGPRGWALGRVALHPPVVLTLTWVPLVLLLDRGAGIWEQRLLGLGTWVLLVGLLRRETPLVRAQVAVVVAFATAVEYTFSPLLEVYVYRLGNVPAFVPPGHGLVYLCALAMGRSVWVRSRLGPLVAATVLVGGTYAAWGLFASSRPDALGAFWYLCLLGFLSWGRSRSLYVGAFVVVTYLELLGTSLGTWEWQTHDPTGLVTIGNPPSGAAGGYGWFDLAAVVAGPAVLAATERLRRTGSRVPQRQASEPMVQLQTAVDPRWPARMTAPAETTAATAASTATAVTAPLAAPRR